jgi:hypothetical protein
MMGKIPVNNGRATRGGGVSIANDEGGKGGVKVVAGAIQSENIQMIVEAASGHFSASSSKIANCHHPDRAAARYKSGGPLTFTRRCSPGSNARLDVAVVCAQSGKSSAETKG